MANGLEAGTGRAAMADPRVLQRHWRHEVLAVRAGVNAEVVEAFDINDTANDVTSTISATGNIQSLTAADLDCYGADAWLLSPPCQPYTRQESDTHTTMIEILGRTNFVLQEFILSPLQFGVPYSRPRYFCLAKRKPSTFYNQVFDNQLLRSLGPLFGDANADETVFSELDEPQESRDTLLESCEPIESFLEFKNCSDQSESNFGDTTTGSTNTEGILEKDEGNGYCSSIVDQYIVPLSLVERWKSAVEILRIVDVYAP